LLEKLHTAKGTGTYLKYLKKIAKLKVLLIDDFIMQNSTSDEVAWLIVDVIEEKQQTGSIIVTTQYPVNLWHKKLPDSAIADALCDRLIHTAYKFQLK